MARGLIFMAVLFPAVFALAAASASQDRAREIWRRLEAGALPAASSEPSYFTGSCAILEGGAHLQGGYYALFALADGTTGPRAGWTISYRHSPGPHRNPYEGLPLERYPSLVTPKRTAFPSENRKWVVDVSQTPLLFAHLARDPHDPDLLWAAGRHLGFFYCELRRIR